MNRTLDFALIITADGNQAKAEIAKVTGAVEALGTAKPRTEPFAAVERQARGAAAGAKLAAHETANLAYQMNDIAMMLATGQSPFVVMMQQGMQVSQIMGSRGLGSILPALAGGLASLINPTTLFLAGITAAGYAASTLFAGVRRDTATADEALADHEAAIKALKAAWGEAGRGVKDYLAESAALAAFRAEGSTRTLRSTLEREARGALNELSYYSYAGDAAVGDVSAVFNVKERFAPFKAAIEDLRASIEAGRPEVGAFLDQIVAIADAEPSNRMLQDLAAEILAASANAETLARALPAAEAAIDGTAAAAARAELAMAGYSGALERIAKAQSEADARSAANAASHHARTLGDALKAAQDLDAKLMELEGRGAPIPGERPNREDVLGEEEARATKAARAQDRLAGAIAASTARAELELALTGASLALRQRATAAIEAEQEIRARGLDTFGAEAEQLRRQAEGLAALRTEAEKSAGAWDTLRSAGESAIDGVVDRLAEGDLKGALQGLAKDITRTTLQLSVANPLKNALFGGDNPELGDLRQGGGLVGRLLGLKAPSADAIGMAASRVAATMHVSAATVIVNGGTGGTGLGGALAGAALPANDNSVAGQAATYFANKGLSPHQVAGILGNLAQESGFDPRAVGDGGTSFGLAQHHAGRGRALLDFIGGKGNLGDVGKQLDFIWNELQGPENGVLKRLLQARTTREATAAFAGYERPKGWTADNPEAAHGFVNRLKQADAALERFGRDATVTASTLNGSSNSLAKAGEAMRAAAAMFPAAPAAPAASGLLKTLSAATLSAIGGYGPARGLYDRGGFTGAGDPASIAGLVHREEYVFSAAATRAIGPANLEALHRNALRGFAAGGFAGPALPALPSTGGAAPVVQIVDQAGVAKRTERARGPNGEEVTRVILEAVGAEMADGGYDGAFARFGARPVRVRRGGP